MVAKSAVCSRSVSGMVNILLVVEWRPWRISKRKSAWACDCHASVCCLTSYDKRFSHLRYWLPILHNRQLYKTSLFKIQSHPLRATPFHFSFFPGCCMASCFETFILFLDAGLFRFTNLLCFAKIPGDPMHLPCGLWLLSFHYYTSHLFPVHHWLFLPNESSKTQIFNFEIIFLDNNFSLVLNKYRRFRPVLCKETKTRFLSARDIPSIRRLKFQKLEGIDPCSNMPNTSDSSVFMNSNLRMIIMFHKLRKCLQF